jgi:hypothetical protein
VPRRPPLGLLLAAVAAACSNGGSASAVRVEPVGTLSAHDRAVCTGVTSALPRSLGEAGRRPTDPDDGSTAAWGDPAIVLRCGVPEGSPRDDLYVFDDVRWAMHDTGATRTWTTLGRAVNVAVVIPDHYDGQAELLGSMATALAPTGR